MVEGGSTKSRKSKPGGSARSASPTIDVRVGEQSDWRGGTLARIRALIKRADPEVVEERKWGVPVWSRDGIICTGETYKSVVKMTFARGAALEDPAGLFNSSLEGRTRRAIDFREGDAIDERALTALVRAGAALNASSVDARKAPPSERSRGTRSKPRLLSGGNPQITKGEGDAPVQAYITAMPGWKRNVGRRLDALIERAVPGVHKAVKWNSPLYGIADKGWFLGIHCFAKYVKVGFFRGASLRPLPPGASKQKDVRYLNIHEGDRIDDAQFMAWVKQASRLPLERM